MSTALNSFASSTLTEVSLPLPSLLVGSPLPTFLPSPQEDGLRERERGGEGEGGRERRREREEGRREKEKKEGGEENRGREGEMERERGRRWSWLRGHVLGLPGHLSTSEE